MQDVTLQPPPPPIPQQSELLHNVAMQLPVGYVQILLELYPVLAGSVHCDE